MEEVIKKRFSASIIRQGRFKFYTLTIPSDVLAQCSFVSFRDKDPKDGFQRNLDETRAMEIATYIDSGKGSIPSAIVLSAQPEAKFKEIGGGKTIEFEIHPKSLLILDGQHRVFGFTKAESTLRVPAVIYNGLNRTEEARLFIDINTKQRPVPNELLLDIKNLAQYETNDEAFLNQIFNLFDSETDSPLLGLLSASKKIAGKINRVSFYAAVRPIISAFREKDSAEAYDVLKHYLSAFIGGLENIKCGNRIVNPIVFRATLAFFPEVAQRVKDKFNNYSEDAFVEILANFFSRVNTNKISRSSSSYKELYDHFSANFRNTFTI